MANEKVKPIFDKPIFWDVDVDRLDYDKRAAFASNGYLNEAMYGISAIAGVIMAMSE